MGGFMITNNVIIDFITALPNRIKEQGIYDLTLKDFVLSRCLDVSYTLNDKNGYLVSGMIVPENFDDVKNTLEWNEALIDSPNLDVRSFAKDSGWVEKFNLASFDAIDPDFLTGYLDACDATRENVVIEDNIIYLVDN